MTFISDVPAAEAHAVWRERCEAALAEAESRRSCTECGTDNESDAAFCKACGRPFREANK